MIHNSYKNFDKVELVNGIILFSKCHNDFPFTIMNNEKFGFKVLHSDEVGNFGYVDNLDLYNMATYMNENSKWVVCIPYKGNNISPNDYFVEGNFDLYNKFDTSKIPWLPNYFNCSVTTGFCE